MYTQNLEISHLWIYQYPEKERLCCKKERKFLTCARLVNIDHTCGTHVCVRGLKFFVQ